MRFLYIIGFLFLSFFGFGQVDTCYVGACGKAYLYSSYDPSFTHTWICSNGITEYGSSPIIDIDGESEVTCILTVEGGGCTVTQTIHLVNCPVACELLANIEITGDVLLAALNNCEGLPSYQWQKYNTGTSTWVNVGTNSPTYNTGGVSGTYKVIVDCGFGCSDETEIEFVYCELNVVYVAYGLEHDVTTTGCVGPRTYTMQKETTLGAGDWTTVETVTSYFNSYFYFAPSLGSYRIVVTCGACERIAYSNQAQCTNFTATTTVPSGCIGDTINFGSSHSGGTAPVVVSWFINNVPIAGPSHVFTSGGVYAVQTTFVDDNGCEIYIIKTISITDCCEASNSIAPLSPTLCVDQILSFSSAATSGTSPYTFEWSYRFFSGPWMSAGFGTPKNLSFPDPGSYTVKATMTDATGCTSEKTTTVTVTTCSDCICEPLITIVACTLNVTFTGSGCDDATYSLQYWNGSTWLSMSPLPVANFTFAPTSNGLYRVIRFKDGCLDAISNIVNVTCYMSPCEDNPTLALSSLSFTSCTLNPVVITGNVIGGSATTVTATDTGLGIVTINWINDSTFTFTYSPALGDAGTFITINITTDNPDGPPCIAATQSFGVNYVPSSNPNITSSISDMCVNTQRTITYTPLGGTLSVVSGPGVLVGSVLTATSAGNITIRYSYTSGGCTNSVEQIIRAVECIPTLTLSSCSLSGSSSGTGCSTYTFKIEFSSNGTSGWVTVATGTGGTTITYSPTMNGFYRMVMEHPICNDILSANVNVTCVLECPCEAGELIDNGCQMVWNENHCLGYTTTLQAFIDPIWVSVSTDSPFEWDVLETEYRLLYQKAGCPDVYSDTVDVGLLTYTFQIDPVSPAPESYIFDRDSSTDPVLEDLVTDCAPYDGYILGGTSNSWDVVITSSEDVTWSYSHYNDTIAPNLYEVSRTSNSIRFHVKGAYATCGCGAIPPITPVCGVTIVNAMMRLTGRDECDNVVFDRILLKYTNN